MTTEHNTECRFLESAIGWPVLNQVSYSVLHSSEFRCQRLVVGKEISSPRTPVTSTH